MHSKDWSCVVQLHLCGVCRPIGRPRHSSTKPFAMAYVHWSSGPASFVNPPLLVLETWTCLRLYHHPLPGRTTPLHETSIPFFNQTVLTLRWCSCRMSPHQPECWALLQGPGEHHPFHAQCSSVALAIMISSSNTSLSHFSSPIRNSGTRAYSPIQT